MMSAIHDSNIFNSFIRLNPTISDYQDSRTPPGYIELWNYGIIEGGPCLLCGGLLSVIQRQGNRKKCANPTGPEIRD